MILVQHTEQTAREKTVAVLTSAGYECRQAGSLEDAWSAIDSGVAVDLLLCKIELFEGGVIERISQRTPTVTWGAAPLEIFFQSVRRGACDYLRVPFEHEKLLAVVRRALDHHCLTLTMTPQKRSEMCYDIRCYTSSVLGLLELGDKEKAYGLIEKIDELVLRLLVDARVAAEGTPDYKPFPF